MSKFYSFSKRLFFWFSMCGILNGIHPASAHPYTAPFAMNIPSSVFSFRLHELSNGSHEARPGLVIKGQVTDSAGNPLVGVSVSLKGTSIGTATGTDGTYSLDLPDETGVLVFSYVGYIKKEVPVAGHDMVNVVLKPGISTLNQLVVVGYGTQKKKNLTGAVSTISSKEIEKRVVSTVADALQGADPSLNITFGTGVPDREYGLNIRGVPSINGGSPLVIVDGIEVNLNEVNPHDIASVTVLKDASAQAIYGAKASAGVVLITTKSGLDMGGKSQISFMARTGIAENTTTTDFIRTGYDHVNLVNKFYNIYKGLDYALYSDDDMQMLYDRRHDMTENPSRPWTIIKDDNKYYYYGNTDWYGYFFRRQRPQQEYNISAKGGSDEINYYVSGRYWAQDGIFKISDDKYNNYSFYAKVGAKIKPWLNYKGSISFNSSKYQYGGYWNQPNTIMALQHQVLSSFVPRNPDGTIVQYVNQLSANSPIASGHGGFLTSQQGHNSRRNRDFILSNSFDIDVTKNLVLTTSYAYKNRNRLIKYREMPFEYSREAGKLETYTSGSIYNFYQEGNLDVTDHNVNVYGTFDKSFKKEHHLTVVAGGQFENYRQTNLIAKNTDLLSEDLSSFAIATGNPTLNQNIGSFRTLGFFGRINYDYKGKYLLEMSGRWDGTSRFEPSDRWGFFPSASVGWRMSEENFWKPFRNILNNGKLRLSVGSLGNQQVDYYAYIDEIIPSKEMSYTFDGNDKAHYSTVSNPISSSLTWETITTYNIGLDLSSLQGRLSFTGDYFIRDTKNMLAESLTLPAVYGASTPLGNVADLRTKGWEIDFSWNDHLKLRNRPFHYNVTFSLGDYVTTITKYNNPDKLISNYYVGRKLGDIWGYRVKGLFKTDAEAAAYQERIDDKAVNYRVYSSKKEDYLQAGDVEFIDVNGDGIIDQGAGTVEDPGDRQIIGNSQPRYSYSIRVGADWHGIDISAFFQGIGKRNWYPSQNAYGFWGPYSFPIVSFVSNDFLSRTWSEDNPDAYFPKPRGYATYASGALGVINDRYLQNVAYLRFKNLTIGYILPLKSKSGFKIRIYASGENICYWSKLKKYTKMVDPEIANSSDTYYKDSGDGYNFSKTYNLGVNITF